MLINISNHPSEKWSQRQLEASLSYGALVTDIPFPTIDASSANDEIIADADKYSNEIIKHYNPETDAIHIMGEMTFTYSLVKRLRKAGFRCVASTTERVKQQLPDGSFISEFRFQSFRDYE